MIYLKHSAIFDLWIQFNYTPTYRKSHSSPGHENSFIFTSNAFGYIRMRDSRFVEYGYAGFPFASIRLLLHVHFFRKINNNVNFRNPRLQFVVLSHISPKSAWGDFVWFPCLKSRNGCRSCVRTAGSFALITIDFFHVCYLFQFRFVIEIRWRPHVSLVKNVSHFWLSPPCGNRLIGNYRALILTLSNTWFHDPFQCSATLCESVCRAI